MLISLANVNKPLGNGPVAWWWIKIRCVEIHHQRRSNLRQGHYRWWNRQRMRNFNPLVLHALFTLLLPVILVRVSLIVPIWSTHFTTPISKVVNFTTTFLFSVATTKQSAIIERAHRSSISDFLPQAYLLLLHDHRSLALGDRCKLNSRGKLDKIGLFNTKICSRNPKRVVKFP